MSIIVLCVIQHPFRLTKSGKIHHAAAPTRWISSEQSCREGPLCEWPSARRVEVGSRRLGERKANSYHSNLSSPHQCEVWAKTRAELKTKQTLHPFHGAQQRGVISRGHRQLPLVWGLHLYMRACGTERMGKPGEWRENLKLGGVERRTRTWREGLHVENENKPFSANFCSWRGEEHVLM